VHDADVCPSLRAGFELISSAGARAVDNDGARTEARRDSFRERRDLLVADRDKGHVRASEARSVELSSHRDHVVTTIVGERSGQRPSDPPATDHDDLHAAPR